MDNKLIIGGLALVAGLGLVYEFAIKPQTTTSSTSSSSTSSSGSGTQTSSPVPQQSTYTTPQNTSAPTNNPLSVYVAVFSGGASVNYSNFEEYARVLVYAQGSAAYTMGASSDDYVIQNQIPLEPVNGTQESWTSSYNLTLNSQGDSAATFLQNNSVSVPLNSTSNGSSGAPYNSSTPAGYSGPSVSALYANYLQSQQNGSATPGASFVGVL